jgi:pyridinium-3,5-biscarboxylic acid mononucleotide sulfurtransferase
MSMQKYAKLIKYLEGFDRVAIAFSGGVDSTFLIKTAFTVLSDNAIAITINTPYIPDWEIAQAKALAKDIGIRHEIIDLPIDESILNNPQNRCYLCKHILFETMTNFAGSLGYDTVMDGSNADDTSDYRPGMKALTELKVVSPLLKMGLTKTDIRAFSKDLGLSTHDKPAYACLLTRLPHDTIVLSQVLMRIEQAEVFLHTLGIKDVRIRTHGDIARIELKNREKLFDIETMNKIDQKLKRLGYAFVTMDLAGYKMGSFNEEK